MVPEGVLMACSVAACNFPKFSGNNVEWRITQYEKFCHKYLIPRSNMVFNVCQFLTDKQSKWHDIVLEFDSWDKWKSMATKHFGDKHIKIIKKLETIHIQERKLQKGHKGSSTDIENNFNSGIGLTFFKRAVPIEYHMAIEEHNIEDLQGAYELVKKFHQIKVENLPDDKAKHVSAWNPFSKKSIKEPENVSLSDKLTEVLQPFLASGKPAPRYNNGLCLNCRSSEHQAKDCPENVNTTMKTTPVAIANSKRINPEFPPLELTNAEALQLVTFIKGHTKADDPDYLLSQGIEKQIRDGQPN
ncbi:hypothetical protein DSO57_1010985 [Entomophthora muscae]|uniref:Uncharacterized protein n=1 Tax=Entomophthora muscae TaxID=34485 RepID=A0ACC2US17_9FUNG|nr:hypothetical protein DSO57_1010985 [Entomophthora muscae]